jgi:DNA-binding response OmpR family regulator
VQSVKDTRLHVIVVEDEPFQRDTLSTFLRNSGYRVSAVDAGPSFRKLVEKDPPALALLDLNLPGSDDGFALANFLRQRCPQAGVIMLTVSTDTFDQVTGLETSADDYISKPYVGRTLLARMKAVLRRATGMGAAATGPRIRVGKCLLDLKAHRLTDLNGEDIPLRSGEFELLKLFVENPNRPLTREWLLESTSGGESEIFDRAIDLRVLRIRRKVEVDPARPAAIRTVRRAGYMFIPPKD